MSGINPLNAYTHLSIPIEISPKNQAVQGMGNIVTGNQPVQNTSAYQQKFIQGQQARDEALSGIFDDKSLKRMGVVECSTCAARTYVDGSDDPSVSFKAPTHISPGQSVQAVTSHEMEHVNNEQAAADSKGGQVISQSVSIHMSICPECGVSYAAGGITRTTVKTPIDKQSTTGNLVDIKL